MWLIVFMVIVIVPIIITGLVASWWNHQVDKENEAAAMHKP